MDELRQSMRVDSVFAALSDPTRRTMLDWMAAEQAVTPTVLAAVLPITRQAVSRHLAVLEEAGLARSSVSGRERRYAVAPEGLAEAEAWIVQAEQRRADRLHALKAFVEASEHGGEELGRSHGLES